jgi:hypothetical protein
MNLRLSTFLLIGCILATAACTGKSSSSTTEQSNAMATATAAAGSPAASMSAEATTAASAEPGAAGTPAGATNEAPAGVPIYPGAVSQGSASFNGGSGANAGSMKTMSLTTTDSFDKVYAFYQKSLPGAMEMMHTSTPPTPGAAFVVTDPNTKVNTTVVIAQGTDGKVNIAIETSQSNH